MGFDKIFKTIQRASGVKMSEVFKLADSIKGANFKDEKTVRDIIKKVGAIANKPVSKSQEDQLVKTITDDPKSINMDKIVKMMDKKKK